MICILPLNSNAPLLHHVLIRIFLFLFFQFLALFLLSVLFICQFCIYDSEIASLPYFVLREWNMGLLLSVCFRMWCGIVVEFS